MSYNDPLPTKKALVKKNNSAYLFRMQAGLELMFYFNDRRRNNISDLLCFVRTRIKSNNQIKSYIDSIRFKDISRLN